jgi:hypothetical protein
MPIFLKVLVTAWLIWMVISAIIMFSFPALGKTAQRAIRCFCGGALVTIFVALGFVIRAIWS